MLCYRQYYFDRGADEEDPILQSLPIIPKFPNIAEEEVNGAEETFTLDSSLIIV